MTVKQHMQVLVENITGRKCSNCKYNKKTELGWSLCSNEKVIECTERIYPKYWAKKE